jgi:hypothetical protein
MTHVFSVPCQLGGVASILRDFDKHLAKVDGMYGFSSPSIERLAIGSYRLSFKLISGEATQQKIVDATAHLVPQGDYEFDATIVDNDTAILLHFTKFAKGVVEPMRLLFLIAIDLQAPDPAVEHALATLRARGDVPKTVEMTMLKPKG